MEYGESITLLVFLQFSYYIRTRAAPSAGVPQIVCSYESFRARCQSGEVVSMQTAMYGRMRAVRCFEDDQGPSECISNVLAITDKLCSGKRHCEITIPNAEFDNSRNCFKSVKGYFEGTYTCLKVSGVVGLCKPTYTLDHTRSKVTLSSSDIMSSPCSDTIRHLELRAKPGQQINVSLTDFMWGQSLGPPSSRGCVDYGEVQDRQTQRQVRLCGGQQREATLLVSISSSIQLHLRPLTPQARFLLTFTVMGCEDLSPPSGAWMNRSHSRITMGCAATGQVWHLTCVNNRWSGQMGECLGFPVQEEEKTEVSAPVTLPNDIIITIIAAIAFLLAVAIITAGVIVYKRSERRKRILMQQQQLVFQTLKAKVKARNSTLEEATYLSPTFIQPERPPGQAHRPDSAYESIQVFSRTLPSASSASNTMTASMIRQHEEDPYNASQSSSSTYTNPLKYFVLDKNIVNQNNA